MSYKIDELYKDAFGTAAAPAYKSEERDELPKPVHPGLPQDQAGYFGRNIQMPISLGSLALQNEPLIELTGYNNLVSTPLAGSGKNGTVKEIINTDDFRLRIRGIIVNDQGLYPAAEVLALRNVLGIKAALPVYNAICRLFGIRQIVIVRYKIFDMEGVPAAQAYEIDALSDADVELTLIDKLNL